MVRGEACLRAAGSDGNAAAAAVQIVIREAGPPDIPKAVAVINEAFMADAFFKKPSHYNRTSEQEMAVFPALRKQSQGAAAFL